MWTLPRRLYPEDQAKCTVSKTSWPARISCSKSIKETERGKVYSVDSPSGLQWRLPTIREPPKQLVPWNLTLYFVIGQTTELYGSVFLKMHSYLPFNYPAIFYDLSDRTLCSNRLWTESHPGNALARSGRHRNARNPPNNPKLSFGDACIGHK